jgi:DNA-binding NarL/FixJ family response regulator
MVQPTDDIPQVAPIKLLLADDHPLVIAGIRRALEHHGELEIVGEARSGPELLALIERRRPDVVLMDFVMPGMSGADCIAQIRADWPDVKVIVLSAHHDRGSIDSALEAGATTYVVKSVNPSDLASIVVQVCAGNVFHRTAAPAPAVELDEAPNRPNLTQRERAILHAVAAGRTTAAISREECVSEHTVKFHLTNIYRKLGVANRAAAVRCALEQELVAVG